MMAEYKQVRLNPEVRGLLDDYKMDGESYSIAIGRLFKENELLRDSQDRLMKMAMKTPDSIALPEVSHKTIFSIMEILKIEGKSHEEKIDSLKNYLRPSLEENPLKVFESIQTFKMEISPSHSEELEELSSWILNNYEIYSDNEFNLKIDEDLLSAWSQMMKDHPDQSYVLNIPDFVQIQMEKTAYQNHYYGTDASEEELKEMRKRQRKLKIPQ